MKVAFPDLYSLLDEAKDPIRVTTDVIKKGLDIPYSEYYVVVTALLETGEIGEFVHNVGRVMSFKTEELKQLSNTAHKVQQYTIGYIKKNRREVRNGQYTEEPIIGESDVVEEPSRGDFDGD